VVLAAGKVWQLHYDFSLPTRSTFVGPDGQQLRVSGHDAGRPAVYDAGVDKAGGALSLSRREYGCNLDRHTEKGSKPVKRRTTKAWVKVEAKGEM
jgi:hypothetical protein